MNAPTSSVARAATVLVFMLALANAGRMPAQPAPVTPPPPGAAGKSAAARSKMFSTRKMTAFYSNKFDLSGMPHYAPQEQVSGKLQIYGNNYVADSQLGTFWKGDFSKFHPGITYDFNLPSAAIAFGSLYLGDSDLAMDHEGLFYDLLAYERVFGADPICITAVTGSYDVIGWANTLVVMVNSANPLSKITMTQLDGVFGSRRDGGWDGTTWRPDWARESTEDLHTWGKLGLTGEWTDKEIITYGYSLRYQTALDFSDRVIRSSDKWNENLHAYGNYARNGKGYLEADQIMDHLVADPYGIAYTRYHANFPKGAKVLSLAEKDGGSYVDFNIENVQSRAYPLYEEMYFFAAAKPGQKLRPVTREFLRYVLSQEGQAAVERDGKYLPLTPAVVDEQLKKLDAPPPSAKESAADATANKSAASRTKRFGDRARKPSYTKKFDLSGLPEYQPQQQVSGTVHLYGNNYISDSGLADRWKEDFHKHQPGVTYDFFLPSGAVAFASLYLGKSDLAMDHEPDFYDRLGYNRVYGAEPVEIKGVTGSYDVTGWDNTIVVLINKSNPLAKISMPQLDGVFGSRRDGGWDGTTWRPDWARGADGDIRTWDRLGLTGDWAGREIVTYGFSLRYATAQFFADKVLQSSDKWNANLHAYGNYMSGGTMHLEADQIVEGVSKNLSGIGYARFHPNFSPDVKILSLAAKDGGPYVDFTIDNVQNRTYPLFGEMNFYAAVKPGEKLHPVTKEFLRYILSRDAQELVERDGKYLPLNAATVADELKKLGQL